jgi:hypothetical protein
MRPVPEKLLRTPHPRISVGKFSHGRHHNLPELPGVCLTGKLGQQQRGRPDEPSLDHDASMEFRSENAQKLMGDSGQLFAIYIRHIMPRAGPE